VLVYAGVDPLTGQRMYLTESTTNEAEAKRILTRLLAEVDEQRHAKTRATFRTAMESWLKIHEVDETTRESYEVYARLYLYPAFGDEPVGKISPRLLEELYAELRRCRVRCDGRPFIEHRIDGPHECRVVKHRYPPGRRPTGGHPAHDCAKTGCKVTECLPHRCRPLAASTIRRIHAVVSAALTAAVRWEWIKTNPATVARKPRQPAPQPDPPTVEQAGRIVEAAWAQDADWGTLVWLVMVTGLRRAELLALRWFDVDFDAGVLYVRRNYLRRNRQSIEKDTKTHQLRRLSLDPATVDVLRVHRQRYEDSLKQLGLESTDQAFLFSHEPERGRPYDPSGVTHRYTDMCAKLGINTHLHVLRHYSATELLTAGVDLRTVAGRLGHAGGGATTLRVYAAWVNDADRRAADILSTRLPRPVGIANGSTESNQIGTAP
jgi:integrase